MTTSKPQRKAEQVRTSPRAKRSSQKPGPAPDKSAGPSPRPANKAPATENGVRKKYRYKLKFHPEALDEWRALDNSVRQPLKKALEKRLDNPRVPGGELHPPLAGCYKIKLRKAGVRLVYEIEDEDLVVYVLAADKREDDAVYHSATARVKALTAEISAAAKKSK